MGRKREYLGGAVMIDARPTEYGTWFHARAWRTHLWIFRPEGIEIGVQLNRRPWPSVWLALLLFELEVMPWAHREDCDCDYCVPF